MSGSWTSGYVADIGYTYGFYRELTPNLLRMCLLSRGLAAPDLNQPLTFCELGCGQGLSTNLLAASNPGIEFYATDFNPAQIAGARALAKAAGTPNVHFFDDSFQDFIDNPELPSFDFIALHGIYSWISAENRQAIVRFIARHLKPGGVVYISYNTMPGWASLMPLRRLLVDHAATSTGPIIPRIEQALGFVKSLNEKGARYFANNPGVKDRLQTLTTQPRAYLAHEYMNRDWTPFYFADVAQELSEAKLTFGSSANLMDHIDSFCLTNDQLSILSEVADPVRREGVRDYLVNQQFRRDIFVKGPLNPPPQVMKREWLKTRLTLIVEPSAVKLAINTGVGQVALHEPTYTPLINALAMRAVSLEELMSIPQIATMPMGRVVQALSVMVAAGYAAPCLPLEGADARRIRTAAFNDAVMNVATDSSDLGYLASPLLGSGINVDRIHMLFVRALQGGLDPAAFAWATLKEAGQRLLKDGAALQTDEENIQELRARAALFNEKVLPLLRKLEIA